VHVFPFAVAIGNIAHAIRFEEQELAGTFIGIDTGGEGDGKSRPYFRRKDVYAYLDRVNGLNSVARR
jgi:hypothetical protein